MQPCRDAPAGLLTWKTHSHILSELGNTNTAVFPDASRVLLSLLYKPQKITLHLKLQLEFILLLFYFLNTFFILCVAQGGLL